MKGKTIILTGNEVSVQGLDGSNAAVRNDGTELIFVSADPGIVSGADGVISIPAGQSAMVYGISGRLFLLGTGSVMLITSDHNENPFKSAASSGGSGADDVARAAISTHAGSTDIHVTAADKAAWDSKAGLSDIINRNMLDNSDFRINQRGQTDYSISGSAYAFILDRWVMSRAVVSVVDDGISAAWNGTDSTSGWIQQHIENASDFAGLPVTVSALVDGEVLSGTTTVPTTVNSSNSIVTSNPSIKFSVGYYTNNRLGIAVIMLSAEPCVIGWIKAEIGENATLFVPPNAAEELAKCQRYYQIRSTGDVPQADLRPSMRAAPSVTQRSDGNYAYSSEF